MTNKGKIGKVNPVRLGAITSLLYSKQALMQSLVERRGQMLKNVFKARKVKQYYNVKSGEKHLAYFSLLIYSFTGTFEGRFFEVQILASSFIT